MRAATLEEEIEEEYELIEKIGTGAFGFIMSVRGKEDGCIYACKIQKNHGKKIVLVEKEFQIMFELMRTNHFPRVLALKKLPQNSYIVMEKLDYNLEDLFIKYNRRLSLQTVALIIDQTVQTLRIMHDHGYLHRDLKPQNFMVKMGSHEIKLIDFGLADTLTVRKASQLIGNVRFCSRQAHFGYSSKKDDLQSLMMVLFYLTTGSVPWQSATKQQIEMEINRKAEGTQTIDTPILQGKHKFLENLTFPTTNNLIKNTFYQQFAILIKYAYQLRPELQPNYTWIQSRCKRLLLLSGTRRGNCYQWCTASCPLKQTQELWDVFSSYS